MKTRKARFMKRKYAFLESIPYQLKKISGIEKILEEFKKVGRIHSYENLASSRIDTSLSLSIAYRINYLENRYFDFVLQLANFNPINGAELAKSFSREVTILVGKNCSETRIEVFLRSIIKSMKRGVATEESCKNDILWLIDNDQEISKIFFGVKMPTSYQDEFEKIDLILLSTKGREIPLQIKSDDFWQKIHNKYGFSVNSITYSRSLLPKGLLKNYLLKLRQSHLVNKIEHL
jgi:hypothetical protein